MKRTLSLILTLIMVMGIFTTLPVSANAASVDNLIFHLNEDKKSYTVDVCRDSAKGNLIIPSEYNGLPVTNICEYAFTMCSELTSITIPDSVTSIGSRAFSDCEKLKTITIGGGVKSIGTLAFYNCKNLEKINVAESNKAFSFVDGVLFNKDKTTLIQYLEGKTTETYKIPKTVKRIGEMAFAYCTNIKSVIIPDSVKTIEQTAFLYCFALSSVTMGNGITDICDQAFSGCISLESIKITKNVTNIADGVFLGCFNLKKIIVDDENNCFVAANDVLFDKDKTILIQYPAGKTKEFYIIPSGVKHIGLVAFVGCGSLEKITIPDSVKNISEGAFLLCNNLKSVEIPGSVTKIGKMAFGYCVSDTAEIKKIDGFTIYGAKETAAEKYAKYNRFTFETACAHKSTKWVTYRKATVYKAGSKHKVCAECGAIFKTEKIGQLKCSKPAIKKISNTEHGVKITLSTVKGADKYYIYRKTSDGSYSKIGSTTKTYYTDKTAKSGTKYYYIVKAINEAGASNSSSALSKYYLADPTLNTPSSTSKGIGLKWSKVTGASGYMVYRRTTNGSYKKITTEKGVSNVAYRDTTAKKGTKYYYKIKAYYSKTYSEYSNTKSITDKY